MPGSVKIALPAISNDTRERSIAYPALSNVRLGSYRRKAMSEGNKAIIRRFVDEVINGGNVELVDQLVAPNYAVHDQSNPDRPNGIDGVKGFIQMFKGGLSEWKYTIEGMMAENDSVMYRWTMEAVHSGPFMGIPPTGKRLKISGVDIFRVENGKIVESWAYADALGMLQQLGVIPPMGPPPK
jgi:steroid delta-isomerase-like uncharacterized protein